MRSEASTSGGGGGRGESVVADVGRRKSTCGYCKSGARTSITHGQCRDCCFSPQNVKGYDMFSVFLTVFIWTEFCLLNGDFL